MLTVILFVCALRVQASECGELTAVYVAREPDCKNEIVRATVSQAYLAPTGFGRTLRENENPKIRIEHKKNAPASWSLSCNEVDPEDYR